VKYYDALYYYATVVLIFNLNSIALHVYAVGILIVAINLQLVLHLIKQIRVCKLWAELLQVCSTHA